MAETVTVPPADSASVIPVPDAPPAMPPGSSGAPNISYTYHINPPAVAPAEPARPTAMPPDDPVTVTPPAANPPVAPPPVDPGSEGRPGERGAPSAAELRAEAAAWRVQYQQQRDAFTAKEAELTAARADVERQVNEARTSGDARAARFRDRAVAAELKAHATQAGIVDLDLIPLIDRSAVDVDDDGNVTGVEAAVAAFKVSKPVFFRAAEPPAAAVNAPSVASPPLPASTGSGRTPPPAEANPPATNVQALSSADYRQAKRAGIAALRGRY